MLQDTEQSLQQLISTLPDREKDLLLKQKEIAQITEELYAASVDTKENQTAQVQEQERRKSDQLKALEQFQKQIKNMKEENEALKQAVKHDLKTYQEMLSQLSSLLPTST